MMMRGRPCGIDGPLSSLAPALAALVVLAAGCGNDRAVGQQEDLASGAVDMPGGGGDDSGPTEDFSVIMYDMAFPEDLAPACMASEHPLLGNTGEPCAKHGDCLLGKGTNKTAFCFLNSTGWNSGYCASPCRMSNNPAGLGTNPDCPGSGVCVGTGENGNCEFPCTAETCRPCYRCFVVSSSAATCQPASHSQCDPKIPGSCPFTGDGKPQNCGPTGPFFVDDVGTCGLACDPLRNLGCGKNARCFINEYTGEPFCRASVSNFPVAGDQCAGNDYNDCGGGYGCLNGQCWKYCSDSTIPMQCNQGSKCEKFTRGSLPTRIAGICTSSR